MIIVDSDKLPFGIWSIKTEEILRGKWVTVSAQLEFLLSKIIIYCNAKTNIINKFNRTKFDKKISWAKTGLSKGFPDLFNPLEKEFNKIYKLKSIRNEITHRSILFDENEIDRTFITVRDIVWIKEKGENQIELITYKLEYLENKYLEFEATTKTMVNVWAELVNDYNKNNPNSLILSNL